MEAGLGPWAVFALFLISSSVVLGVEWKKECDGGLRTWLLTAVCVTAVCGILGVMFNGRGEGSGPSRFLGTDDDCDDDCEDIDASGGDSAVDSRRRVGMVLGPSCDTLRVLPVLSEEGCSTVKSGDVNKGMVTGDGVENGMANGTRHEDGKDEEITSVHGSSVSVQFASRAASSLQRQYFGPGPKVYPDAVFLVLVVSQWFLAAWSVVGAVLYFRIFERGRSCSPLLRHWTLLVVIIGFLSCLLAVCYSGIMCCMLGTPIYRRRRGRDELRSEASTDSSVGSKSGPTGSMI